MPSHLAWDSTYSVGVGTFDADHQELISRADALISAVNAGQDGRDALDDLIEAALHHFENEEQALREVDYPGLEAHRAAHHDLLRAILKFKCDLRYGRLQAEEAAEFIVDWVLAHIKEEDAKYRPYLHCREIGPRHERR